MRFTRFAALLGLSLVACRGTDGGGDDVGPQPDGPVGGVVHIQDIQNDDMPKGTAVEVKGVVVTAIDAFGARTGDIWVEEPGGGEFSGIKVFGAPLDQIASLQPGDIVTISNAEKDEFALNTDTSGRTVTELKGAGGGALVITKTGTGTVPAAATVDAKAIAALSTEAERDAEWEKWEGVLINVTNARQSGAIDEFGTNPDQQSFAVTGDLVVETVLAPFPADAVVGTCYAGIVGVGDYFFDHLLLPRAEADYSTGGTGCAAEQFATIEDIQGGTVSGAVTVKDVFVTAISFNKKNVWVSSSMTAGANAGIFVFRGNGAAVLPPEIIPGAKVTITGNAVENNDPSMAGDTVTQIAGGATITLQEASAGSPAPVSGMTAAQLTVAGTGEPFESVLVTLTNVKVNTVGDGTNFGVGQLQQGTTTFLSDDDVFRLPASELNKCYASITGIWTYQVFDDAYGFLPLAVGTGTGTCN